MGINRGVVITLAAGLVAAMTGCGDDAPDQTAQAERAAALAAEYRAGTTTPDPDSLGTTATASASTSQTVPVDTDLVVSSAPATDAATGPVATSPVVAVAPTGVVVPVVALDNSFRPEQLTVQVGDEVVWENNGRNEHNILNIESADRGFVAGGAWGVAVEAFQPGDVFSRVFAVPGNYRYYCTIHGNTEVGMVGTITVEP